MNAEVNKSDRLERKEDELLRPLSPRFAMNNWKFPPGCAVVALCSNEGLAWRGLCCACLSVKTVHGVVERGIDMSERGSKGTVYEIRAQHCLANALTQIKGMDKTASDVTLVVHEKSLYFAEGSPVWLDNAETGTREKAVVDALEATRASLSSVPVISYSVRLISGSCKVYDGIPHQRLVFRSSENPPEPPKKTTKHEAKSLVGLESSKSGSLRNDAGVLIKEQEEAGKVELSSKSFLLLNAKQILSHDASRTLKCIEASEASDQSNKVPSKKEGISKEKSLALDDPQKCRAETGQVDLSELKIESPSAISTMAQDIQRTTKSKPQIPDTEENKKPQSADLVVDCRAMVDEANAEPQIASESNPSNKVSSLKVVVEAQFSPSLDDLKHGAAIGLGDVSGLKAGCFSVGTANTKSKPRGRTKERKRGPKRGKKKQSLCTSFTQTMTAAPAMEAVEMLDGSNSGPCPGSSPKSNKESTEKAGVIEQEPESSDDLLEKKAARGEVGASDFEKKSWSPGGQLSVGQGKMVSTEDVQNNTRSRPLVRNKEEGNQKAFGAGFLHVTQQDDSAAGVEPGEEVLKSSDAEPGEIGDGFTLGTFGEEVMAAGSVQQPNFTQYTMTPPPNRRMNIIDPFASKTAAPSSSSENYKAQIDSDSETGELMEVPDVPPKVCEPAKLHLRARPSKKRSSKKVSTRFSCSTRFCLPYSFGLDFLAETIMGKDGVAGNFLCTEVQCRISIGGGLVKARGYTCEEDDYDGGSLVVAHLKGPKVGNLLKCQLAMEEILYHAVHPRLRACLLHSLAVLNNHRDKKEGIVLSRDPLFDFDRPNELQYMTVLEAGKSTSTVSERVGFSDAQKLAESRKYPQCRIDIVEAQHLREHPLIGPHIAIWSPYFDDVVACRRELQPWLNKSPRSVVPPIDFYEPYP